MFQAFAHLYAARLNPSVEWLLLRTATGCNGSICDGQIEEIKSVPYAPVSHPFIARLIGTVRREYLDRMFFWNSVDLARKLDEFRDYYNAHRVHRSLNGATPAQRDGASSPATASLDRHAWRQHCRGLFQTPNAA